MRGWITERNLQDKPAPVVALYHRFTALAEACGPLTMRCGEDRVCSRAAAAAPPVTRGSGACRLARVACSFVAHDLRGAARVRAAVASGQIASASGMRSRGTCHARGQYRLPYHGDVQRRARLHVVTRRAASGHRAVPAPACLADGALLPRAAWSALIRAALRLRARTASVTAPIRATPLNRSVSHSCPPTS